MKKTSIFYITLFIAGFAIMALATRHGGGTTSDSVVYIDAANQIASSGTYNTWFQKEGESVPVTHFPPAYALLIAFFAWIGMDAFFAARLLNCFFFGANAALLAVLIRQYNPTAHFTALAAGILALFAPVMLDIHTMIGTEPLFIFLTLLGIYFLNMHWQKEKAVYFYISAAIVSLAFLTRYVGITLIAAIALTIFLIDGKTIVSRFLKALIFGIVCIFPMVLFILRNILIAGNAANRRVEIHPFSWEHVWAMFITFQSWLLPGSDRFNVIPAQEIILNAFVIILIGIFIFLGSRKLLGAIKNKNEKPIAKVLCSSPFIFVVFIFMYVVLVIISISLFDKATPMSDRILSPVYVSAVIIMLSLGSGWFRHLSKIHKPVLITASLYLFLFTGLGSYWVYHSFQNGRGFTNTDWKYAKIAEAIKAQPEDLRIYSNNPYVIYILTGRPAMHPPLLGENYESRMSGFMGGLKKNGALIAYFDTHPKNPAKHSPRRVWEYFEQQMDDIRNNVQLEVITTEREGALYLINQQ